MSFDVIAKFEQALAAYTGAPYAIMTDCCTHALELCFRYDKVKTCRFTPFTYISVPQTMHKLGIKYNFHPWQKQEWTGEYFFTNTRIWDSARRLEHGMYRPGQLQCLSFGFSKPLDIGRGGAILLDDAEAYEILIRQRYDGRDLKISPWEDQRNFLIGYHYRPTIEEARAALDKLPTIQPISQFVPYPDLRKVTFTL
jgi:dTDP-4-amino-4,6-dideoxygalactose transaminase